MKNKHRLILIIYAVIFSGNLSQAQRSYPEYSSELPVIPIGLDAYRYWHTLPLHKIGIRAYMRSTYDRMGNNYSVDASHFLYQESDTFNVTMDVKSPGILYFKRTNHFHGSPWHYEIDGNNLIVKETATEDPIDARQKYETTHFIPEHLFPKPLTYTWTTTKGANLNWVPLGFEDRLRIAYSRTYYGTGYYIYHSIPKGTDHLSRPLTAYERKAPDQDVLDLLGQAGKDIVGNKTGMQKFNGKINAGPYETLTLAKLENGPSIIRAFSLKVPVEDGFEFGKSRLKITWDNNWHTSIDAPVGLFFGAGELYNADKKELLVKGLPLNVRYDESYIYLNCYWPMPYFGNALIELQERNGKKIQNAEFTIYTETYEGPLNHLNYFHATYSDHPEPVDGEDIVFLDTKVTEGGGDWSGHFVGMSWIFSRDGVLKVLEGDPRFFFDDNKTPQAQGTGSEEWGGGGDYWGGQTMTIPLAGHPIGKEDKYAKNEKDLINSAYRFLIADYFPFGKRAVICLEHGGLNTINEHISGVVYWYGVNSPSLILTDQLNVCNATDRERHNYFSPTASPCYALVSRYEWGPDTDAPHWSNPDDRRGEFYSSKGYFFAEEDSVRTMTGTTQFTATILEDNHGVMIRRKFDYFYPNQHANIYVRKTGTENWNYVGIWYTPGSNTCVHSYPQPRGRSFTEAELLPSTPEAITSNRRWREEEFIISSKFTRGIEKLDIKIEFDPYETELFPGNPFPGPFKWSESRYWIYSWVLPEYPIHKK